MNADATPNPTPSQPDTTPPAVPVASAAAALGITSDAVRARIRRGKLQAEKRGGAWFVFLSDESRRDTDATESSAKPDVDGTDQNETRHEHDGEPDTITADAKKNTTATTGGVIDLEPLADVIAGLIDKNAELSRHNADLSATAAMWQTRAAHLEDQLKQLTAGGGDHHEAVESPESAANPEHGSTVEGDADHGRGTVWDRLRKWFR